MIVVKFGQPYEHTARSHAAICQKLYEINSNNIDLSISDRSQAFYFK